MQNIRNFTLHALRAGTGIHCDHHQIGGADVRQQIRLHLRDGHKAQDQHHHDSDQHREWFFDTEFFHFFLPFLCPGCVLRAVLPNAGITHFHSFHYTHKPRPCKQKGESFVILRRVSRIFNNSCCCPSHFCCTVGTEFGQFPFLIRSTGPECCTRQELFVLHRVRAFSFLRGNVLLNMVY